MKTSDSKKSKLQQEIIELKKKLESDTLAHRESELALRKVLPISSYHICTHFFGNFSKPCELIFK